VVDREGAAAAPWIAPDNEPTLGVYGVFADERAHTLWACFSSFPGTEGAQAPSALNAYDLDSGKLKARYVLPTKGHFATTSPPDRTARPMSPTATTWKSIG
jgi:hypothetical protein